MYVTYIYIYSLAVAWVDEPFFSGDKCQVTSSEKDSASLTGWHPLLNGWDCLLACLPNRFTTSWAPLFNARKCGGNTIHQVDNASIWRAAKMNTFQAERLSLSIYIYIHIYIYSISISIIFRFTCIHSSSYLCIYLHHIYLLAIFCDMLFPLTE